MQEPTEKQHRAFKIDLIVWKYKSWFWITILILEFKIDLIVWKSTKTPTPKIRKKSLK